ncbi:endonuclease NucS [Limnothrix sp. PR1529]|uniref:endonuclease NucS n=1 Tax=Limnothrix sp. PR1529 TaxID=1704291 RepID=UPI00081D8098|nr:endonuclease NucS [Limnothrix sp. PR1529]OCQ90320.1 hypothetical protein BCR12_15775 [Limnothrix sp. P13C2]
MLIEKDGQWQFESEATFERLLWQNLEEWLNFQPLARQLRMCGEPCDIIARSPKGKPVILELKNEEDRYVVQQLTRYYHNFLEERPDLPDLDTSKSPRLVAITPSLHRHNFIDRLYHRLTVELWTFHIRKQHDQFLLELVSWETPDAKSTIQTIDLTPHIQLPTAAEPDPLSQLDKNWKSILSKRSEIDQKNLLAIRDYILSFSPKLGEVVTPSTATYGQMRSKTNLCESEERLLARFEQLPLDKAPRLFLYLPSIVKLSVNIVKVEILLQKDNSEYSLRSLVHSLRMPNKCRKQYIYMMMKSTTDQSKSYGLYEVTPTGYLEFYQSLYEKKFWKPHWDDQFSSLEDLLDLAILDWQRRQDKLTAKRRPSPSAE